MLLDIIEVAEKKSDKIGFRGGAAVGATGASASQRKPSSSDEEGVDDDDSGTDNSSVGGFNF